MIPFYLTEGLFSKFMTHLSVVIPVYNESSLIEELVKRVKQNVKYITEDFEIIIVDDGSQDKTWELIKKEALNEKRIKGIKFTRNFGHHFAITAGLHNTSGEWVVVMDGDLQDRPEVIPVLYEEAQAGYEVVFVSRQNRPEKQYYKIAQKIFYLSLKNLSGMDFDSSQANFSIISRKVVEAFRGFPESSRFYGSTIKWLGFSRSSVLADHGTRFSGKPSYTIKKRVKLASDIIISFSDRPLKFAIGVSITNSVFALGFLFWVLLKFFVFDDKNFETSKTLIILILTASLTSMVLGMIGLYLNQIFNQVKNRPLYVIEMAVNFDKQ